MSYELATSYVPRSASSQTINTMTTAAAYVCILRPVSLCNVYELDRTNQ